LKKCVLATLLLRGGRNNMPIKVLVVGGSGMLGSQIVSFLSTQDDLAVSTTVRTDELANAGAKQLPNVEWHKVALGTASDVELLKTVGDFDWIINAIGATNRAIDEQDFESVDNSVKINVGVPVALAKYADETDAQVLQIATDCVYSGANGPYNENALHDALDVYGKSKSLGEIPHSNMHHLRCSIIGPEPKERKFLLEWVLSQPQKAKLSGYSDHIWNGVTTLQFAKIAMGLMRSDTGVPKLQHLIPADVVTKAELLRIIALTYGRDDLIIEDHETGVRVDRSLKSIGLDQSKAMWTSAGYSHPPTISEMVLEQKNFNLQLNFEI